MNKLASLLTLSSGIAVGWFSDWMLFRKQLQGEADALRSELKVAQGQAKNMERKADAHQTEVTTLRAKLTEAQVAADALAPLQAELSTATQKIASLEAALASATDQAIATEEASTEAAHAAASADGDPDEDNADGEPDNLERIEGIGPKTKQILLDNGVLTFAHLASGTPEELTALLKESGFKGIIRPDTWPEQAALAADGKWDALQKLQDELVGGQRK